MHIAYKNDQIYRNDSKVPKHQTLTEIEIWLCGKKVGGQRIELVCTSSFRKNKIHKDDPGIHGTNPLRAKDYRSWLMRNPEQIRDFINQNWIYDPKRPHKQVCVYHKIKRLDGKKSGYHFHIQVHDNTVLKDTKK